MRLTLLAVILLLLLPGFQSHSQTVSDTLNQAKKMRAEGKIHQAYSLLKETYRHHPDDLNVAWLTAQTAFWANRIVESKRIYEKAVKANPNNLYLKLDYAKMLVNSGNYKRGEDLLSQYIVYDPKSKDAYSLLDEINLARSPYLKLSVGYTSDDQIMQTLSTRLEMGFYFSSLFSLHYNLQAPVFIRNGKTSNALLMQVGNTTFISNASLKIGMDLGIVKFPFSSTSSLTGNVSLDKIFIRHLEMEVSAQRNPYFSTLSSIDTMVIQNHFTGSIGWNKVNSWNGKAAIEAFTYPSDHNLTISANGWIFAPPVKFSVFQIRFGYSYNYSDAKKNHYVAERSLPEIISSYNSNTSIAGVYNPYFTPENQQVHSFLLSFNGHPLKWMDFRLNASAGLYATTNAPYLYLDKNASDSIVLKTGFAQTRFYPVTVELQILMKLSERFRLQADYTFRSTYFYTSNYAGLGLNIHFGNGKKR